MATTNISRRPSETDAIVNRKKQKEHDRRTKRLAVLMPEKYGGGESSSDDDSRSASPTASRSSPIPAEAQELLTRERERRASLRASKGDRASPYCAAAARRALCRLLRHPQTARYTVGGPPHPGQNTAGAVGFRLEWHDRRWEAGLGLPHVGASGRAAGGTEHEPRDVARAALHHQGGQPLPPGLGPDDDLPPHIRRHLHTVRPNHTHTTSAIAPATGTALHTYIELELTYMNDRIH